MREEIYELLKYAYNAGSVYDKRFERWHDDENILSKIDEIVNQIKKEDNEQEDN